PASDLKPVRRLSTIDKGLFRGWLLTPRRSDRRLVCEFIRRPGPAHPNSSAPSSFSLILPASDLVHILCLDDRFATTIMPQPAEITQFIFGRPLRAVLSVSPPRGCLDERLAGGKADSNRWSHFLP